jgi:endonuclease/exonuclease/phosphatase family metal-dependent hydrolase
VQARRERYRERCRRAWAHERGGFPTDPTALHVATFNIRHASRATQFGSSRALRTAVRTLDVDVLGLQEVDRFNIRSWFADQVAVARRALAGGASAFAPARRHLGGQYGNALVVCGRVVDHETMPLPRPAGTEPRVALVATVDVRGVTASVVVTHLHNDDEPTALIQLDAVLGRLTAMARPWLLLADLNLDRERFEPVLQDAGLVLPPLTLTVPWDSPRRQIDCVAAAGLDVAGARAPLMATSDHRPIVADLTTRPGIAEFPTG